VLESLARVFRLDAIATEHLLSLSTARPAARRRPPREVVPAGILRLLDAINLPAFVESRMFDVLAANRLASAVSPNLRPGVNRLRTIFLDPAEQALYPDWEKTAGGLVAGFRASVGGDVDDPRTVQLVGELSLGSDKFRRLWARHDVTALAGGSLALCHPQLGRLELSREKLPIADSGGQILAIYHAEPGSESARALESLRLSVDTGSDQSSASGAG
jgi:hypothetical protein